MARNLAEVAVAFDHWCDEPSMVVDTSTPVSFDPFEADAHFATELVVRCRTCGWRTYIQINANYVDVDRMEVLVTCGERNDADT